VKKNISIISFVAISMLSLHAMELEVASLSKKSPSINGYGSLSANVFDDIEDQQQEQSKSVMIMSAPEYLEKVHSSLKLDEWCNAFRTLSEGAKRIVVRTMSTQLLYLHAIVFCLPPEVVKDHIISALLDGEEEAVKIFYGLPFGPAFDVYHDIKSRLADDSLPIGPLYAKSPEVRALILKVQKNPWYYSQPVVNFEDNAEIGLLPDDIKSMYLRGKEILVLPDDEHNECTSKKLCIIALIAGGLGTGLFGGASALGASISACGCLPFNPCDPITLGVNLAFSYGGVTCCVFCGNFGRAGYESLCVHSQKVTI
jgi:hypothetical protein